MLPHAVYLRVTQLLAKNYGFRTIARLTGVHRDTIRLIAAGKTRQPRPDGHGLLDGPLGRCPDCGAMVVLPCRSCRMRRLAATGLLKPLSPPLEEPLGLQLRDDHQARFEEVLAQRRAAEKIEARIRKQARALRTRRRWFGF